MIAHSDNLAIKLIWTRLTYTPKHYVIVTHKQGSQQARWFEIFFIGGRVQARLKLEWKIHDEAISKASQV